MDTFDSGVCNGAPFTDPDGNRLLLHRRYAPPDTWDPETTDVERTDFVGVNVTDRDNAVEFYEKELSEPSATRSRAMSGRALGADNVGFVLSTPEQKGGQRVQPRVLDRVPRSGRCRVDGAAPGRWGRVRVPEPYDSGVCHMAFLRDPDGNRLMLASPVRALQRRLHALMQVEQVDFVSVPSRDIDAFRSFYATCSGCRRTARADGVRDAERDALVLAARARGRRVLERSDAESRSRRGRARPRSKRSRRWRRVHRQRDSASATWRSSPTPTATR